jgi:hypothetical protein
VTTDAVVGGVPDAYGCEFPDTLHPLSADQAGLIVELLARLHATFWHSLSRDGRGPLGWLYTPSSDVASLLTGSLMNASIKRLAERTAFPVDTGRSIADNYRAVAALSEPAYTLITSMTPEDRRATQHVLLDDYRRALAAAGGRHLGRDDIWLRYRQAALYAYVAVLITVAALDDLETIAALKSSM